MTMPDGWTTRNTVEVAVISVAGLIAMRYILGFIYEEFGLVATFGAGVAVGAVCGAALRS